MINYYLLTKPGIILGNLITVAAGFFLASKGIIDIELLFATILGLTFIMASACVFNNFIDRHIDKKMERTKNRALVKGLISNPKAIFFGILLGILGNLVLFLYTNPLTVFISAVGFFVYVVIYSYWKCHTVYGTAIGSIAGAVPPIVGYCAVSNHFDVGALILFMMLILWQMPHFFSIALYHFNDYLKAGIPLLPIKKGVLVTKIHMVMYIVFFIFVSVMLTFLNYTGITYLMVTTVISFFWLALAFKGFKSKNDQVWGKQMFHLSLLTIIVICCMVFIDTIPNS